MKARRYSSSCVMDRTMAGEGHLVGAKDKMPQQQIEAAEARGV